MKWYGHYIPHVKFTNKMYITKLWFHMPKENIWKLYIIDPTYKGEWLYSPLQR